MKAVKEYIDNKYKYKEVLGDTKRGYYKAYEYSTSGNYTITLPTGEYTITAVSGGGGGGATLYHPDWSVATYGGTGAYYTGTINLSAGTYTLNVGSGGAEKTSGGETSVSGILTLSGGSGAYMSAFNVITSNGGSVTYEDNNFTGVISINGHGASNVSIGNPIPGSHSNEPIGGIPQVLSSYGNGGGFSGLSGYGGTGGYLKLLLYSETEIPDYDYYVEYDTYFGIRSYAKGERYGN